MDERDSSIVIQLPCENITKNKTNKKKLSGHIMIAISDVEQVGIQESYAVIVAHLLHLFVYPAAFIIYFPS